MRRRPSWWRRLLARGEISVLRALGFAVSEFYTPYTLDSSRVDYALARALYRNTDDRYKLGAGFARPVINTTAGFMGVPHFVHVDPEADNTLERVFSRWSGKIYRVHRNALRDGDAFARIIRVGPKFGQGEGDFELRLIPPEWVTPIVDPITGGYQKVIIRYPGVITDDRGNVVQRYTVTETITPNQRTIEADSRAPAEVRAQNKTEVNPWGFIPIVHYRNEAEETELYGASDLEPLEPFLKAYHDVMLFAVQGSKLFSRPKAKFLLKNVREFLRNNFSEEEIKSGKLRFQDKEIFLLQDGDDAAFITADSGLSGITTLLKFLFFCIVDVSETPEFAFGTAVSSSKASVSEQMVPLARKIRRKRGQFEEAHMELAGMVLAMWAKLEGRRLDTYHVDIGWDEISPKDDAEVAQTIKTLVEGLAQAVESGLMSLDAAADFLREFVPSMLPWSDPDADDDERRRVARSMLMRHRLEIGQGLEEEAGLDDEDMEE